ncbi:MULTISPECIES: helicase HerA-like domain-containing protein [Terrabacteria group]|uniref:helicase HerA-like domain-containing protein n=1 Tax=Bacillati TaxID=1783272 RepID=UPI001C6E5733|nr:MULTISPECIES: helicase HerA-like domain-containing protein [Terrabacteria group]MBW9211796.1 DUF853 domain-containing protein [Trueperella sp. zg.1013]
MAQIILGKANGQEVVLETKRMNRHGLIAGASGSGKTVTVKHLLEECSQLGIPSIVTDIKGDVSGLAKAGNLEKVASRIQELDLENFEAKAYPVEFIDANRELGIPFRFVLEDVDPLLLAKILGLNETQEGILTILYSIAHGEQLDLIDLEDLKAMLQYVLNNTKEFSMKYGLITSQSISSIQRKVLAFEKQGGQKLFGLPDFDVQDLLQTRDGKGLISILSCQNLFLKPTTYATLMWILLDRLFQSMSEVGDLEQPKLVVVIDEAHLLFQEASSSFLMKFEQMIKLIRSKGIGVYLCSQSPSDIPNEVLGQLSNRIQHTLRAYTPVEIKKLKGVADSFRANPDFDSEEVLQQLAIGEALVSCLQEDGIPAMVQRTLIYPIHSSLDGIAKESIQEKVHLSPWQEKYGSDLDPESANEKIAEILQAQQDEKQQLQEEKEREKEARRQPTDWQSRLMRKARNRTENELVNVAIRSAKKLLSGFFK